MQIFETDSALGYQQSAILLLVDNTPNKHGEKGYLCLDTFNCSSDDSYTIGEITFLEDYEVSSCSNYDIKNSPLYSTFLFKEFLKNNFEGVE